MPTRSHTILAAQAKIIQGSADSFWTNSDWNDYYHEAIDIISQQVVEHELPFYFVRNEIITKGTDNLYPLNEDVRSIFKVVDTNSSDNSRIYQVDEQDEEDETPGFVFENGSLRLLNYGDNDLPATLTIDYRKMQPYLGDWTGGTDAVTVVPMAPLNTVRGERLIVRLMNVLAKAKDENLTPDEVANMERMASVFCQRLEGVNDTEEPIISD